jgi:hypothetical protein
MSLSEQQQLEQAAGALAAPIRYDLPIAFDLKPAKNPDPQTADGW